MSHFLQAASFGGQGGMFSGLRLSEDLGWPAQLGVLSLLVAGTVLLFLEASRVGKSRALVIGTGFLGSLFLAGAVLRPTELQRKGREVPGLVTVLVDASHRMDLNGQGDETRRALAQKVVREISQNWNGARLSEIAFGEGVLRNGEDQTKAIVSSDLLQTLQQVSAGEGERPRSVVVVSDGRLTRPGGPKDDGFEETLRRAAGGLPVHTVGLLDQEPRDRSIRRVGMTGSAVAHQPMALQIEVGCSPEQLCEEVEVVVRELLEGQAPMELTRGKTRGAPGKAVLDLEVTLDRAGGRVIEIELVGEIEDEVPENDRRIFPVEVRRDRLRMLHVAGRPTYDVRALRMFLKADESIDLISFFILRTPSDQVGAQPDELALIPFPVDELFNEHLKSFDAVILQDIHAPRYRLDRHFASLKEYVLTGGGLILVGGPTGFSSGGYAGSPVAEVLPVELPTQGELVTRKKFVPSYTSTGRAAPLLANLRTTMGDELPSMAGANVLGKPRSGALVLWEHPTLSASGQSGGGFMPVLSLGEVGDGRSIAISVDSTHQLRFGEIGARTGGRAYADLWEGLLGWLMRDPRYESAQMRLEGDCIAGEDQRIVVDAVAGNVEDVQVQLEQLGRERADPRRLERIEGGAGGPFRFVARKLAEGGYAARVRVGDAPPTRAVFACEAGGTAWSDSRPDAPRMKAIAEATGGTFVMRDNVSRLTEPEPVFISVRQQSHPLLPSWVWSLLSVLALSGHWFLRRAVGYA